MALLYTIGHSTRSLEDFLALLVRYGIERLVDVRRWPTSRRHPHFERVRLAEALEGEGIEYRHQEAMGGYRSPRPDTRNTAWRAEGFRGYADHMEGAEFREALESLLEGADERVTAVMCAEIVPWRCHRQLIADALVARGHEVRHIVDEDRVEEHELNEAARVLEEGRLIYPAPEDEQADFGLD